MIDTYYLIYVCGFLAKNRCLKKFSSPIKYWRRPPREYWKNHVLRFKKPLSSLVSLLETFVLMLTNFQLWKSWELPKIAYFLSINLFFCLLIELLHTTVHKSDSLDSKLILLLIHNAHSRSKKQFQNANNRTNKEKFLEKNRGFYEDFHIDTTLYMYAGFWQKIDVWKNFLHQLNIEDALQENTEKTMSSASKNHFPALYLFWKPSFWCLQIFNFENLGNFRKLLTSLASTFSSAF